MLLFYRPIINIGLSPKKYLILLNSNYKKWMQKHIPLTGYFLYQILGIFREWGKMGNRRN